MKPLIAVASLAALGAVAATIAVGTSLREETVVKDPYEHGIHHDQERKARERLGWQARFDAADLRTGGSGLTFTLVDRAGAPVEGAVLKLAVTRPAGPGDERQGAAVALGGGRYRAPVGFAAPGFWDVRLDATRGPDTVGLTQQVRIEAGEGAPCDLAAAPCRAAAGALEVTLDLGRSLSTMQELPITVVVTRDGAPLQGAAVEVSFAMKEMNMGENRVALHRRRRRAPRRQGRAGPLPQRQQGLDRHRHRPPRRWRAAVGRLPVLGHPVIDSAAMAAQVGASAATGLLIGFSHCLAMCGPLVASFGLSARPGVGPLRAATGQLPYHLGRITTYGLIGAVMGATGSFVNVAGAAGRRGRRHGPAGRRPDGGARPRLGRRHRAAAPASRPPPRGGS